MPSPEILLYTLDHGACAAFLKKCHDVIKPRGKVAVVEFKPNADRISPPHAAGFSLTMLNELAR